MVISGGTARKGMVTLIGTGAMAGAMLFGSAALAFAEPRRAATAQLHGGRSGGGVGHRRDRDGDYLFSHPT
jgi:hypothetical protein